MKLLLRNDQEKYIAKTHCDELSEKLPKTNVTRQIDFHWRKVYKGKKTFSHCSILIVGVPKKRSLPMIVIGDD